MMTADQAKAARGDLKAIFSSGLSRATLLAQCAPLGRLVVLGRFEPRAAFGHP